MINIVMPLLLPLPVAAGVFLFLVEVDGNLSTFFRSLVESGAYTFLGLTALISLFQNHKHAPKIFKPWFYSVIVIFGLIISFIFTSSLGLIENAIPYEKNLSLFVPLTIFIVCFSFVFKVRILMEKYTMPQEKYLILKGIHTTYYEYI